jgi:APA family basic amino acid/polyamine antiporter
LISASCLGGFDVLERSLGRVTFIGRLKSKAQCWIEFVLGTSIVCVIYVLANLMFLAVVPLQEIATAPADRIGVVASQYILVL